MNIYSRYLNRDEFGGCAIQISGTEALFPIADTLFKGVVRGTFYDGKCYSLQGAYPLDENIGDAWMISDTKLLKKHPLAAHRSAKAMLKYAFSEFDFKRIHIAVPDDFHVKWCESIGFIKINKVDDKVYLVILP